MICFVLIVIVWILGFKSSLKIFWKGLEGKSYRRILAFTSCLISDAPVTGEENDVKDSESVRSEEAMPKINLVVPRRFKKKKDP